MAAPELHGEELDEESDKGGEQRVIQLQRRALPRPVLLYQPTRLLQRGTGPGRGSGPSRKQINSQHG